MPIQPEGQHIAHYKLCGSQGYNIETLSVNFPLPEFNFVSFFVEKDYSKLDVFFIRKNVGVCVWQHFGNGSEGYWHSSFCKKLQEVP